MGCVQFFKQFVDALDLALDVVWCRAFEAQRCLHRESSQEGGLLVAESGVPVDVERFSRS